VARTPDLERRQELLDRIVDHLAAHGLAQATLRPMAAALDVSINRLVHHFGSKEDLIAAALRRAVERQVEVQEHWLRRQPDITVTELYAKWWKWITADPANLALVRLGYEAAALDSTVTGVESELRADQIAVWRRDGERRLIHDGLVPELARLEASLMKATFTGLIVDLLATGDKRRLTQALTVYLSRVSAFISANSTRH
jgi:AcrR family transcriptional regulator